MSSRSGLKGHVIKVWIKGACHQVSRSESNAHRFLV
ncbi:hypothetical protein LEMLEM_LOCUS15303 [Lemmus lemmus]